MKTWMIFAMLTSLSTPALALPDTVVIGLRKCAAEPDQEKRLACFDSLVTTLPKLEADNFGMTADIVHKREPPAEHPAAAEILPGKIVALSLTPHGQLIFTLDNQQVWVQTQAEPSKQFVVGDAVRIEHGSMGSLWLAADKARKTRVKRIS